MSKIERAPFVRIVREPAGGWLAVTCRGHGWLFGSRAEALAEKRWHDQQWARGLVARVKL